MDQDQFDVILAYPKDGMRLFESMIPIGLASIGAVLRESGYRVKIIDFNHYSGSFTDDIVRWSPKLIGVGGTTPTRRQSFQIAQDVKSIFPEIPVVYGGAHASFTAEDTLNHISSIDFVVKGEGEFSITMLADRFVRGQSITFDTIPGLCWRENGTVVQNKHARIEDLGKLPIPARDLFDHNYPLTLDLFENVTADFIITSRGCPAACNFCSAARMFPGGVRLRPIDSVREEIEWLLSRKSIRGIKIFDSTFTAVKSHVEDFCKMIQPYNLLWECEIRADTVDYELLAKMKQSGCCYINMGLETTHEHILKKIAKKIDVAQVEQVLVWCRELGIKTKIFFTFGHIDETFEECLKDISFMNRFKSKIDFFATTIGMRIYPGTNLEIQARKRGLIAGDFSWAKFKAPLSNWLVLEPSDTMVLSQRQLGKVKLAMLICKLFLQGTVLSPAYIKKMILENGKNLWKFIWSHLNPDKKK